MRDKIFYSLALGFVSGVLWSSFYHLDFSPILFIAFGLCLFIFSLLLTLDKKLAILFLCFIASLILGIVRFDLADIKPPQEFEKQVGKSFSLNALIVEKPKVNGESKEIIAQTRGKNENIKILISTNESKSFHYGDLISFTGKLQKPANFLTPQEKEFDYINYLKKDGIFFAVRNPKIAIIASNKGSFIKSFMFSINDKFAAALNSYIPNPEALLIKGLTIGERSSFSDSLKQAFINTGLIHVVAISGYNVTLVAQWTMKILEVLPRILAIQLGIIAVILYVLMTGATTTAIRAGIMAIIGLSARITGRMYDAGRALVIAAVIMVFANPMILAFDVSFQLSFLATIAVIFFTPKLESYFLWIRWKTLRDIITITFGVYVFVLPFILYKIGNWSVVALPANFAFLPFVPFAMISGFLTGMIGIAANIPLLGILKAAALILGKITYLILHYQLFIISFFSSFSFASLSIPNFPFSLTLIIYAIFFFYLFLSKNRYGNKTIFSFMLLTVAIVLTFSSAGILSLEYYKLNQTARNKLAALFQDSNKDIPFEARQRIKFSNCKLKGPLPDTDCTPGSVFANATVEKICVSGYTKTVRNVSQKTKQDVFKEYGIKYPAKRGAYEVDHLIPLAIGGSNDIANLFPEAAVPTPGFHEKDVVEVFLQHEVCGHRITLTAAQRQMAEDWISIYNNLTPAEIINIKSKY